MSVVTVHGMSKENFQMIDNNDIILYTVDDIQRIFKIGRSKAYQLLSSSGFPSIRLNKKLLVEKGKLSDWIAKNSGKIYTY